MMELVIGIACWYGIGYAGALLAARSLTGKPLDSFDYNFALVFGVFGLMIVPIALIWGALWLIHGDNP